MRFSEKQKKELIRVINEKILTQKENIVCFHKTEEKFHNHYTLKFENELFKIEIHIQDHFQHKDIEVEVLDKVLQKSLMFDSHQYFINPKDIKTLINSLIDLYHSEEEEEETNEILKI